ncbi:MAG: tetratricopeptide repeat protein [Candidatus Heimdallarchaeota archaeon]
MLILSSGLGSIQKIIIKGDYFEALKQLEDIMGTNEITPQEQITATILKGIILFRLGLFEDRSSRFNDAEPYFDKAITDSKKLADSVLLYDAYAAQILNYYHIPKVEEFKKMFVLLEDLLKIIQKNHNDIYKHASILKLICESAILHTRAFFESKKDLDKEGFNAIKKAHKNAEELGNKELILFIQVFLYDFVRHMHIDQTIKYRQDALDIAEDIKNNYWKAELMFRIGSALHVKGELEQQLDYTKKAMQLDEKNGNKYSKVARHWSLGNYYAAKYDVTAALEHFLMAIEHNEKSNNSEIFRICYRRAGEAYETMGQLDKALEFYQKAQKLLEEVIPTGMSYHKSSIANVLVRKGELTKGLEILEEMLDFYVNKIGDKHFQARLYFYLKDIYWYKGELKQAIKYTQKSMELSEEVGQENTAKLLYSLILLTKEAGQLTVAKNYLKERKTLAKKLKLTIMDSENSFLEAVLLKESTDSQDWLKSELMLEELLSDELHYFLKVDVLINLCELLMMEASAFNDTTAYIKTNKYLKDLHELAVTNEIPFLTVEGLWLQSKLALISFEVEKSQKLISEALKIATEKGLERLKKKLQEEKENITKIISQLIKKGKEAIPISDRMQIIGIETTFKEVKKQRILNSREEQPLLKKKMFVLKL